MITKSFWTFENLLKYQMALLIEEIRVENLQYILNFVFVKKFLAQILERRTR